MKADVRGSLRWWAEGGLTQRLVGNDQGLGPSRWRRSARTEGEFKVKWRGQRPPHPAPPRRLSVRPSHPLGLNRDNGRRGQRKNLLHFCSSPLRFGARFRRCHFASKIFLRFPITSSSRPIFWVGSLRNTVSLLYLRDNSDPIRAYPGLFGPMRAGWRLRLIILLQIHCWHVNDGFATILAVSESQSQSQHPAEFLAIVVVIKLGNRTGTAFVTFTNVLTRQRFSIKLDWGGKFRLHKVVFRIG